LRGTSLSIESQKLARSPIYSVVMQEGELFKDIGLFPGTSSLHLRGIAVPVVTSLVLMD